MPGKSRRAQQVCDMGIKLKEKISNFMVAFNTSPQMKNRAYTRRLAPGLWQDSAADRYTSVNAP